jgi:Ca2+-binding RTX toxin-like protein
MRPTLLGALLACSAIALALPVGASSRVENVVYSTEGGFTNITIRGSSGDDHITIRRIENPAGSGKFFWEIEDPGGVDVVPEGCFRRDANAIHCPSGPSGSGFKFDVFTGAGNDRFIFDRSSPLTEDPPATTVDGGEGDDEIDGPGNDRQIGGPGNDVLIGQAGNDKQFGGPGKDKLAGGKGNDRMFGGPGVDRFSGGPGRDFARGGGGDDRGAGGPGDDNFRD